MKRFRLRTLFVLVFLAACGALALNRYLATRPPTQGSYTSATLQQLLADGKTVLVTVDADWAFNASARPRYMSPEVSRRIREMQIETLTANWTNSNPSVDTLMKRLNEDVVPTLAIFTPDDPNNPIVLPSHPSEADILNAIDGARQR